MATFLGFLKQRAVVAFLGIVALGLLLWFVGPLIAIAGYTPLDGVWARVLAIALLLGIWAAIVGWRSFAAWLRNRRMVAEITEGEGEPSAELETLRRRMEEALAVLKKARLGGKEGGRRYLYQLPWYILIGAPGSGKTTALVNSGLHFPLAERFGPAIRGVGGTRNCDWLFTDEAVLLDTAGRYTTQEAHQASDHSEWTGFLGLLKRYRPRRPINGALVAISVADLLTQSEAERTTHARAIRQRIQELHEHLGLRVPVYVLLTKVDLLAGFIEFFDDLDREGRAQVWGTTFPVDDPPAESSPVARFAPEFDALEVRLNARLIDRLQQERDPQRRAAIYRFPQQFAAIKEGVDGFLKEAFRPSPYEERPLLRGVYFTSGTQEGTPIDRLMGTLASQFGLDREQQPVFSGTGRSYFITRLFREVLFKEAGLAGTNRRFERRLAWLQRGAYAGTLALVALVIGGWTASYFNNRAYVQDTKEQAQAAQAQLQGISGDTTDPLAVVPALDTLRQLPDGYADRAEGTPWLMGLGLDQGDKLGPAAERAYRRALQQAFLPRLLLRLEEQLRAHWANTEFLYEGLKVYLMLSRAAEPFDPATIRAWMTLDWERNLPRSVSSEQRRRLRAHLAALLAQGPTPPPLPPDKDLIRQARTQLQQRPPAERLYARLQRAAEFRALPPFQIREAAGPQAPLVFTRASGKPLSEGLDGLYTYRGYHTFRARSEAVVEHLIQERWVLGEAPAIADAPEARQRLIGQLRKRYLADYRQRWGALLADLEIAPLSDLKEAAAIVNALAGSDSPLRRLLEAVARQTNLQRAPPKPGDDQVPKAERAARERLAELVGEGDSGPPSAPPDPVTQHFAPLHQQVQSGGDGAPPLQATLALLDELYVYLDGIASAANRGNKAYEALRDRGSTVIGRIERAASRQPPPLSRWLRTLAQGSAQLIADNVRRHLNAMWASQVRAYYERALAGRYPLDPDSAQGVPLADFGRFFGPDGVVARFFAEHLRPFVDTSASPWRWRAKGGNALRLAETTLEALQRAAVIREAFFPAGKQAPQVRFELVPVAMDATAHRFTLDLHGQTVSYRHGPVRPTLLQWPGTNDTRQVRIAWHPPTTEGRSARTKNGPWAWFRLLDEARVEPSGGPERLRVTFGPPEREATFELRATSARNPFQLEALKRFRCPERL